MKVGILTLPLWNNYGGILQAYALKHTLETINCETVLIDLHRKRPAKYSELIQGVKFQIKKIFFDKDKITVYPNIKESLYISQNTLAFVEKELYPKSRKVYHFNDLMDIAKDLDGVIVGSDQVWRPNYTPNIYNYFLDFVGEETKKVSYAASLGTDEWLFTEEETLRCKELLGRFDAVSVREDTAVSIIDDKFGVKADFVLDPTLLLESNDYNFLIDKYSEQANAGQVFTYILDRSEKNKKYVERVSNALGYDSFEVMPKKFDTEFSFDINNYIFPSVTQWLRSFHDAKFIIADSFHGCVFAIIYNKPFIAIGNVERGLSRFYSLLNTFGLIDRLVLNVDDVDLSILDRKINWERVNLIREKMKANSINYLSDSLYAKNE
ncbi:polysaccharide pyruvyl transferase family protein [Aeromonas caviae]